MNIAVIGVGGVGGYFGSKLVRSKKEEDAIYFIARGEHLRKIQERGLIVESKEEGKSVCHPTLATSKIEDLPVLDICLICVKGYDLENVLLQLKDKIKEETHIIPLLNGVDIYEKVRKVIQKGYVYPACVYIGTHIGEPGVIRQCGGQCKIIFGKDLNKQDSEAEMVRAYFERAGIDFSWTSMYREAIWNKFMCVGSYALVTAAYDKTMGEVYSDLVLSQKLLAIMKVVYQIGKKVGVQLKEEDVQEAYNKAKGFPYETKTSFQRDYEKKREHDERETFGGTMIRMAKELDIDASAVEEVYKRL